MRTTEKKKTTPCEASTHFAAIVLNSIIYKISLNPHASAWWEWMGVPIYRWGDEVTEEVAASALWSKAMHGMAVPRDSTGHRHHFHCTVTAWLSSNLTLTPTMQEMYSLARVDLMALHRRITEFQERKEPWNRVVEPGHCIDGDSEMPRGAETCQGHSERLLPGLYDFREAAGSQELVIMSNSFLLLPKRSPSLLNPHNWIFPKKLFKKKSQILTELRRRWEMNQGMVPGIQKESYEIRTGRLSQ